MELNKYIDHTVLKPDAKPADIEKLCDEARKNEFAAVCVNPVFVEQAAGLLQGSAVQIATVVGFPLGANTTKTKVDETLNAIENGATEIDMVMAIGLFKAGKFDQVRNDITEVVKAAGTKPVKVILETCLLTDQEIAEASTMAADSGAAYVKTSTGFSNGGATLEAVEIMKRAVGDRCKIKASGGIKTRDAAIMMVEAGAERIGTSSGVSLVNL
ncbi:MAG: deoxyribose-phosphate aldolase [Deltaproteobacteria bacterium]|jgi:deoxyribose-phosphate aldolase|nr:deoxyribose-phosphate aldolase [Deltaproteobacteria bacterium]